MQEENQNKIKVLLIDDDPDFCFLFKEGLQCSDKFKVLVAKGGNVGAWLASCRWHKPDVIILDILMPGINGFDVLEKLRKDKRTMYAPIIMCSAVSDPAAKIKAEGLYCDDYITKPASIESIIEKINEVLKKRGKSA